MPLPAAAPPTLPLPSLAGPGAGEAVPPVPSRVVRAVLAATRLAPGDRVLVAGPDAGAIAAVLDHLGLRVDAAADGAGGVDRAAAYEAAVWCGPDATFAESAVTGLAVHVRPGRQAVGLRRCDDLGDIEGGVRFADRGRFGFPAGRGGWAMHLAAGRAAAAVPAPLAAAA